jgi:hypothetical protein
MCTDDCDVFTSIEASSEFFDSGTRQGNLKV